MGAKPIVEFTFIRDAAPMKIVEDPSTRTIENVTKRRICHRGLSSAEGKPRAVATESKSDARSNMVVTESALRADEERHSF